MAKWEVTIRVDTYGTIVVNATDEDEAEDMVSNMSVGRICAEAGIRVKDLDVSIVNTDLIEPGEFCEHDDRDE